MDDLAARETASNMQSQGATENSGNAVLSRSQEDRSKKIILAIATFGIIFFICVSFIGNIVVTWWEELHTCPPSDYICLPPFFLILFNLIFIILVVPAAILGFVLTLTYLKNVIKNKRISRVEKTFWVIIFLHGFFGSIMPWLFHLTAGFFEYYIPFLIKYDERNNDNININLVIFLVIPYIAMSVYWYCYLWRETQLRKLLKREYWYIYLLIVFYVVFFLIPVEISIMSGF